MDPSIINNLNQALGGFNDPVPGIYSAPQVQGAQTTAPTNNYSSGSTGPTATDIAAQQAAAQKAQQQALINQYLGQAGDLVNQINGTYNTINGNYGQAVQNQRDTLEAGYAPQFKSLDDQTGWNSNQLNQMMAARGLMSSSYAGAAQRNLADTAGDQSNSIAAALQKDEKNLADTAASTKAGWQQDQANMNSQLAMYQNLAPNDTSGSAPYRLSSFIDSLMQNQTNLAKQSALDQPGNTLMQQLNAIAPSKIYDPAVLQGQIQSIRGSSMPQYLQNELASGAIQSAIQNPADTNYWVNYTKNLASAA